MRFQINFHNQAFYLRLDKTFKKKPQFRGSVTVCITE